MDAQVKTLITAFAYGWIYTWRSVTSKVERNTSTSAIVLAMELNISKGLRIAENVSIALIASEADCDLLGAEPIF